MVPVSSLGTKGVLVPAHDGAVDVNRNNSRYWTTSGKGNACRLSFATTMWIRLSALSRRSYSAKAFSGK